MSAVDDPYSLEQLRDPRLNVSVVRPLVDRLYDLNDLSVGMLCFVELSLIDANQEEGGCIPERRDAHSDRTVMYRCYSIYCLLVNKNQFQREHIALPHKQSICTTRAHLCEIVANRVLRRFHEDHDGTEGLLLLSRILVGAFDPFQGAPKEVLRDINRFSWVVQTRTGSQRRLPALEIAIISESKTFLSSSACQKVVSAIYEGRVIYTPTAFIDILPDHYKNKPISLYNPQEAPLFNQYRLIVPRTRNYLEVCQFLILLGLYLSVMTNRDPSTFGGLEAVFIIYTLGWTLDQSASILEHGWHVYTQNLWSFLDVTFGLIFGLYLVLRLQGWRTMSTQPAQQALDVLAMGAPVLVPRLAFNLMSENMLFVSLRAMMRDFTVLTVLSAWCFAGFLLSMIWLGNGLFEPITVSKWMLWIWFGLDGTGISTSADFHWILGPILMVAFAFLGNTLFLTILVSMLSTTFSTIVSNATAEIQFRRAVLTLEGVKCDALFAYFPPFNLLALFVFMPLKFILTPRWFHKINVAAVRLLNAPLLLFIGYIERRQLWAGADRQKEAEELPRIPARPRLWDFSRGFSVYGDIQAVFDAEPPADIEEEIEADNDIPRSQARRNIFESEFAREFPGEASDNSSKSKADNNKSSNPRANMNRRDTNNSARRVRRDSITPFAGMSIPKHLRDLLIEGGGEETSDIKERLEVLEGTMGRVEWLLKRLCRDLDGKAVGSFDGGFEADSEREETGKMSDLDRSVAVDFED
ncbi:nonselective cation channel protein [Rutstroemia sp. NJR-2017a WRK4]|nr:nonselective cation channel protein [Rutstroemia sp. NJR-2017a WRK4]